MVSMDVGKGNYKGSTVKYFTIQKASAKITLKKSSIKKAWGDKNFSFGASVNSKGKLTYSFSGKFVAKMEKGKAKIVGIGKVTVTVKAAATTNYKPASKKLKLTVTPKKMVIKLVKSKKAGKMTVSWKRDSKASGYTIVYATNKGFKKAKRITVQPNKTTSKTISKLAKKKTYYVKICAYKTVKGKKIPGPYSAVKKIKIKR